MARSWSAKGLLSPLWGRVGGRDALAELTGIHGPSLSGMNTGRIGMGESAGRRIAAALGVTLEELGAPPETAHPSPILQELAAIRAVLADVRTHIDLILSREVRLAELVDKQMTLLEKQTLLLEAIEARVEPANGDAVAPGPTRGRKR